MKATVSSRYSYNFSWLGRPIIQYPQDIAEMQEIIWTVQPDLIVETGIAHGGSLIFSASMLELNAACGGPKNAKVLGIDIDIRPHNRAAIEAHPLSRRIEMIQGSSIAPETVALVEHRAKHGRVLVCLDSKVMAQAALNHEKLPREFFNDRPWGPGNNPSTAISEYLKSHPEFEIDKRIDNKLLISVAPGGYLKRVQ